jgi:hypothetical protein
MNNLFIYAAGKYHDLVFTQLYVGLSFLAVIDILSILKALVPYIW